MRHLLTAAVVTIALAIMLPSITLAQDYINDAAKALQSVRVYVAPGTEGTDSNTAGELKARLRDDDNIILVMLPSAAGEGTDINTLVIELSKALSDQRIIGLSVGRKVAGHAPTLPTGVAADQMRRAESVSNDPVTALARFARYIREWQAEHPLPNPTPSSPSGGLSWVLLLALAIVITGVVGLAYAAANSKKRAKVQFNAPEPVRGLLSRIYSYRDEVQEISMQETLATICNDVVDYFQKSSKDPKRDALVFKEKYLDDVIRLLEQYVELQNNPRVYPNRDVLLVQWREGIEDFDRFVLESTRRGAEEELREFRKIAHTLSAYRDVSFPEH